MKTKNIIYLALLILTFQACQSKGDMPESVKDLVDQLQQDMVNKHLNHNLTQFHLQNQPVSSNLLLRSTEQTTLELADLTGFSSTLIFRYSEIHCNTCIDLVVQKMNELYQSGFTQMAIIASYSEYRHFTSFVRANKLQMPVYLLEEGDEKGIFDTEIPPYLFALDQSMNIQYPFVPIKEMEAGVDMYLNFVQEKVKERTSPLSRVEAPH